MAKRSRRAPAKAAPKAQVSVTPRENEIVLTATILNGSGPALPPEYLQIPFGSVTFGEFAVVDENGNLHFVNPTDPSIIFQFTITVSMAGNNTVHLYARWDQSSSYQLINTVTITAGVAVTLTNIAIPGSGSLLTLYTNSVSTGPITWSAGSLTVVASDQPIDELPFEPPFAVPEGFSEQPAQVMVADAVIADGSYTSTSKDDLVAMPFSYVRWGAATLTSSNSLQFKDLIIDDVPVLSITLSVATAPATNYIWGQWDNNPVFLITETELTTTGNLQINNVPIYPQNYPKYGQGQVLSLYISCSVAAVFNWSNGRVFSNEAVLAWPIVATAPSPPSVKGVAQPIIVNRPVFEAALGGETFPSTSGDPTGAGALHMGVSSITLGSGATINVNGDLDFATTPSSNLYLSMALTATPGPYNIVFFYSWDGGTRTGITVLQQATRAITDLVISNVVIPVPANAHVLSLYIDASIGGETLTYSNAVLIQLGSQALFPAFTPIVPPPTFGLPPPPIFPPVSPATTPVAVPVGPLVGPAVAAAAVPPSLAGVVQPQFATGSGTLPASYFPDFTTTFPNPPVSVQTTPPPPNMITTTPPITLNGWGPSILVTESYGNVGQIHHGDAEFPERRTGAVLQPADADELHQPSPPKGGRVKRVPPGGANRNNH
jgi:hypothetical protein